MEILDKLGLQNYDKNIKQFINNSVTTVDKAQISNPNILINSNFSINQRGNSYYDKLSSANPRFYTFDRWAVEYNDLEVDTVNFRITSALFNKLVQYVIFEVEHAASYTNFYQILDNSSNRINGKTITFSFEVERAGDLDLDYEYNMCWFIENIYDGVHSIVANGKITEDNKIYYATATIPSRSDYVKFGFCCNGSGNAGYLEIKWCKVEHGLSATQYTPPDPATELLRCQRYYLNMYSDEGYFFEVKSTQDSPYMSFPVKMRVMPDITISGEGSTYIIDTNNTSSYSPYGFIVSRNLPFENGGSALIDRIICDAEIY